MKIKAEKREAKSQSQLESLRKQGNIPAVVYGHDFDSRSILVPREKFIKVYRDAGRSTIFDLELGGKKHPVLVQDLQIDPVTDEVVHVDFYKIKSDEKITTEVALVLKGEAPVEDTGGTVVSNERELEVRALPGDLPSEIEVDVSGLEDYEDDIRIKDVPVPEGVEFLHEPDDVVISVSPPTTEEELEALEEKPEEILEDIEAVAEEEEEGEEEELGEELEEEEDLGEIDEELETDEESKEPEKAQ